MVPSIYKYIGKMPETTRENIGLYYGYISASVYIVMILFQPPIGILVDRFGYRPIIAMTTFAAICGNLR
eukprot:UN04409